jgi:predicted glutamine amidotransferase
MCIAVVKPASAALPTKEELKRCFTSNPDGAGIAWVDGDTVRWAKGLMTFEAFEAKLDSLDLTDKIAFLHFRIGTHGGKNEPTMTHPFPVTTDKEYCRHLEGAYRYVAMHNGIIGKYGCHIKDDPRTNYSDTVNFTAEFVASMKQDDGFLDFTCQDFADKIKKESNDAKYVVLGDGTFKIFGAGWQVHNGCHFSNSTYLATPAYNYHNRRSYMYDNDDYGWPGSSQSFVNSRPAQRVAESGDGWQINLTVLGMDDAFVADFDKSKTPIVHMGADFADALLVNEYDEVYQNQPTKKKPINWVHVGYKLDDFEFAKTVADLAKEEAK